MSVFCLHRFALSTNPRIIPAEISRYRLLSMSVSLISRQPMKLQISFGFARAMPTTNPRTGMLWKRDCLHAHNFLCAFFMNYYVPGLSKQADGRRSSGGCYEVYCRLLCFGTLVIFKQVNVKTSLLFPLFLHPNQCYSPSTMFL